VLHIALGNFFANLYLQKTCGKPLVIQGFAERLPYGGTIEKAVRLFEARARGDGH
jgi:hypothetical protein